MEVNEFTVTAFYPNGKKKIIAKSVPAEQAQDCFNATITSWVEWYGNNIQELILTNCNGFVCAHWKRHRFEDNNKIHIYRENNELPRS